MTESPLTGDLRRAKVIDASLRGATFRRVDLSEVSMRAIDIGDTEIDAPWLLDGEKSLWVNGVDVAPLVDAELNRLLPGRSKRRADTPKGLRAAWAAVERAWGAAADRAATPPASVDVNINGEWSFAETLRHLVMATDTWLRGAILGIEKPYHPIGMPNAEYETDGNDMSVFATGTPSYDEVLAVRAERMAMVRDFLATVTAEDLTAMRTNPWAPRYQESVLNCIQTILEEEWEHLRFALRDLDALAAHWGG